MSSAWCSVSLDCWYVRCRRLVSNMFCSREVSGLPCLIACSLSIVVVCCLISASRLAIRSPNSVLLDSCSGVSPLRPASSVCRFVSSRSALAGESGCSGESVWDCLDCPCLIWFSSALAVLISPGSSLSLALLDSCVCWYWFSWVSSAWFCARSALHLSSTFMDPASLCCSNGVSCGLDWSLSIISIRCSICTCFRFILSVKLSRLCCCC